MKDLLSRIRAKWFVYSKLEYVPVATPVLGFLGDAVYAVKREYWWIKKSIRYAKFLRDDYDFDHSYLLKHLRLKLDDMQKHFKTSGWTETAKDKAAEMRYAIRIIDRLLKDEYSSPEFRKLMDEEDDLLERFSETMTDANGNKYHTLKSKRRSAKQRAAIRAEFKREEKLRADDYRQLFNYLNKHIQNWWD